MHPASILPQQDIDNHHKDVLLPLKQCPRYQSGPSKVSGAAAIPDDKESNVELHAALGQSNPKAIPENKNDQEFKVVNRNSRNRHSRYIVGTGVRKEGVRHQLTVQGHYVALFVSRLPPETEDKLVKDYVEETFNVDFKCEKIDTRFDSYAVLD